MPAPRDQAEGCRKATSSEDHGKVGQAEPKGQEFAATVQVQICLLEAREDRVAVGRELKMA